MQRDARLAAAHRPPQPPSTLAAARVVRRRVLAATQRQLKHDNAHCAAALVGFGCLAGDLGAADRGLRGGGRLRGCCELVVDGALPLDQRDDARHDRRRGYQLGGCRCRNRLAARSVIDHDP